MKNTLLIILTITSLKVIGQNHLVGIKAAGNRTNITSENFVSQHDNRLGLSGGLTYEYLLKKHFSIGTDVLYNQRGFTNDIIFTDYSGNQIGEKYTTKFNYDYISLQVKSGFNFGETFYGFANIGIIPSLLVNANIIFPEYLVDKNIIEKQLIDVTSDVTKLDLAGGAEIGGGFKFKNNYWLFATFAYQKSFTTVTNSNYFGSSQIKHNGMSLAIGIKYALSKKEL